MALPAFEYIVPTTVTEAIEVLSVHGPDARVLAGGQSLIPLLSLRLARPSVVVDIGRLNALRYIRADEGVLRIGALTTHREVERSPLVLGQVPLLAAAAGQIGHTHIRNRGTIGGSLAHADPAAELPAALILLDGAIIAQGAAGERAMQADAFFVGPLTTALGPAEILTEVRIPIPPIGHGWAFQEFSLRSGDFALASACTMLTLEAPAPTSRAAAPGRVSSCRIVVGGIGAVPMRCPTAERLVVGSAPTVALAAAARRAATSELEEATAGGAALSAMGAAYRRRLVGALVETAVRDGVTRAMQAQ